MTLASTTDSGSDPRRTARRSPPTARPTRPPATTRATRRRHDGRPRTSSSSVAKTFARRTVTAGGASQTFTIDVTNSGVSDADNVEPDRHGRPAPDRRLDRGRRLHVPDGDSKPDDHLLARRTSPAGATRSITVTYHVASTTDSAAARREHGATRPRTRTAPTSGSDSVDIVEDVDARASTKTFNSRHGHRRRRGQHLHDRRHEQRRLGCRQRDAHRHGRLAPDRRLGHHRRLHLRPATEARRSRCTLAHLAAGATQSITVTYHVATTTEQRGRRQQHARRRTPTRTGRHTGSDTVDIVEDVHSDASRRRSIGDTVTAGGAEPDLHDRASRNSGVSDADNVSLTDTRRLAAARRLDRGRRLHLRARASQSISCTLGHLGGGRDEVDHRHLPRRHDDRTATPSVSNTAHASSDEDTADAEHRHGRHRRGRRPERHKTFDSDTVTAGGASQTFTIAVTTAGVSDADNVSLTDTVDARLIVDSIAAGGYTCAPPSQSISLHARAPRGGRHEVDHRHLPRRHDDRTARPASSNTARRSSDEDGPTRAATRSTSSRTSSSASPRRSTATRSRPAARAETFTIAVHNAGVSDADNVQPHRHGRLAADRRLDRGRRLHLRRRASQSIACSLAHLAAGATKSITVTYHVATTTEADRRVPQHRARVLGRGHGDAEHRHGRDRRGRQPAS